MEEEDENLDENSEGSINKLNKTLNIKKPNEQQ